MSGGEYNVTVFQEYFILDTQKLFNFENKLACAIWYFINLAMNNKLLFVQIQNYPKQPFFNG